MLEEDAMRTVDCLRGRLQAERAASKAAQHNAHLMTLKLKELEKQLKIEAKSRRKAEKKLNFLKNKLESLNIPLNITILEEFDGSISSNNSEISCMSSIASASLNNNQQNEDILLNSQVASKTSSITSEITEERESESHAEHKIIIQDIRKYDPSARDPTTLGQQSDEFCHGFNESSLENIEHENMNQDDVDKMALVPVTSIVELEVHTSSDKHLEVKSENIREILSTLKHIRENLQNSLEKRRIIKVG